MNKNKFEHLLFRTIGKTVRVIKKIIIVAGVIIVIVVISTLIR